ncbi:uncharacterized protein LOC129981193 isoform X1 [Argiope bruennichi]|uniref:uncharacterized protein LOC129981193 isoform X1 n=1 Tax=Argiope bruennichi TaxID=94029 RepID=UPI0024949C1E|nr:uncharacterized protein LOC129981193 isoform X1 [Argiope bruennichi]
MRVLLVLFLAGFALAAASPLYELDQVDGFGELADDLDFFAEENKDDLIQKLKDKFQEVVKKVKDAIDQGKSLKEGLETLEKIRKKLKEFNIDLGDFGNEYLEQLKEKVKDYWKKLKDRLGVSKRNTADDVAGMIQDFKQLINEEYDPEKIKAFVTKHFGENEEMTKALTQLIKEYGKESLEKIREFFKKFIDGMIGVHNTSNNDVFEQIRDFFKDFGVEIKNRFTKFGEWVKEQYKKGLEKSKNKLENVKKIAKEFLEDTRKISRDVAEEALDFFREYKKDLGIIFDDIEVKVKDILKQD